MRGVPISGSISMDDRQVVIHAHMYQPPRENPWLEAIEIQDGAYPWHDWNERVTAESYAPNAYARILDEQKKIIRIANNYKNISFNFGPTLLGWLAEHSKPLYEAIIEADRASVRERSGHGNAIAQCYNHVIMPLATRRDKITQVIWGIEDFTHRFSRPPEGMWLPETAVDEETLEILASQGIKFTILAPHQAHMVRGPGASEWTHVDDNALDTRIPYSVRLPSGARISVFFYDGPAAKGVAFEGLLSDGVQFAERLMRIFSDPPAAGRPELAHIATDGESYGHHSRFGEMALAYCLYHIERNNLAKITNYGEFLEKNPPDREARIRENTSWSCYHGVERWRADCGCSTGAHPGWNQGWRTPLREAMDWLSDRLARSFEEKAGALFRDPWLARDRYIEVILDRADENAARYLGEHSSRTLSAAERVYALKLLELQRHGMLMFTSCGWFFDDISGIEALQVLQYACRAIQLHGDLHGEDLEEGFLRILSKAKTNIQGEAGDGEALYRAKVRTKAVDLDKVSVHYAISSLYEDFAPTQGLYCFDVTRRDYQRLEGTQGARLALGRINVRSRITGEEGENRFAAMRTGIHDINCWLCRCEDAGYEEFKKTVSCYFHKGELSTALREMDRYADGALYSLKDLFRDKQREILSVTISERIEKTELVYERMYEQDRYLMALLADFGVPIARVFLATAEFALGHELVKSIGAEPPDMERAAGLVREMAGWGVPPDHVEIELLLRRKLLALLSRLGEKPGPDPDGVRRLRGLLKFASMLPFALNLWEGQNVYYGMARSLYRELRDGHGQGADAWAAEFRELGGDLNFNTSEVFHE
ncbi:MAG: DUF3536 domain-containing protein [Nitrospiraceae bacterium]|nr:DUF3536 domain-containing protein [Nitrospiraceae bacterium]